jgi:transcriptional regulator with XRE-family HTH domain
MAATNRFLRSLGEAIRERRESLRANATQEDVAHRARLTVRTFQKVELGQTDPRLGTLLAIAKALRINLQSLLDRAEELQSRH